MNNMQTLHHKKNEKQEIEFYEDKECTIPFDFTNAKDLYIGSKDGDATPLLSLYKRAPINRTLPMIVWTPYLPDHTSIITEDYIRIRTLEWITPNLSKYIPEDNAVLFLSADCCEKYMQCFQSHHIGLYANDGLDKVTLEGSINAINEFAKNPIKKLTIFLTHGTQAELQKANEVEKELQEKYGIEEVNLCVLHCFCKYIDFTNSTYLCDLGFQNQWNINKIITTNSTGILKPEDSNERLQVINCKEIFEDFLNGNN
jgi:hypothetical protein